MSDYENGFKDGFRLASELHSGRDVSTLSGPAPPKQKWMGLRDLAQPTWQETMAKMPPRTKPKRKLSAWNKFVKANSKKKKYIYQSGAKRGKLNLKKMGVDYRKKKR